MKTANSLVNHIVLLRQDLRRLESQLHDLQTQCVHKFTETTTHRECQRCQFVESIHY